ncbi:hypothetical protein [Parafilimonas sp.]|uniref:hypothetical protein n=1 Tax=Parafilimonas sp. TaxID=1969739 RepID=UPI0039E3D1F1
MDEIFHVNVGSYTTDTHNVIVFKTRLWPYILMSLKWLIRRSGIPSSTNLQNGLGLIIINNLAMAIEGLITDIIIDHLDNYKPQKPKLFDELNKRGWRFKKDTYNKTFKKQLETYSSYKSIENLFLLRNNIAHGKTHLETNEKKLATDVIEKVKSVDNKYQQVRLYLIEQNVIRDKDVSSNADVLWTFNISKFFFEESLKFIQSVIHGNESSKKVGIEKEFQMVLHNKY